MALIIITAVCYFIPVSWMFNTVILFLTFAFCIYTFLVSGRKIEISMLTAELYSFLFLLLGYAMLGYIWAYDKKAALDSVINISQYIAIFFIFSQLLINRKMHKYLVLFFQSLFVLYIFIFLWEITTGNHFPQSRLYGVSIPIPTGPFVNENNAASLCLLLLPFLTVKSRLTENKMLKLIMLVSVFLFFFITILQGARLTFIILFPYLIIYFIKRASAFSRIVSVTLLVIGVIVVVNMFPGETKIARIYLRQQFRSIIQEQSSITITSLKIRQNLLKEGLDFSWKSGFMGIGGGNFEDRIRSGRYRNTGWIENAHNFWVETLATYGIFILLGFIYFYLRWMVRIVRLKNSETANNRFYQAVFQSLLLFLPLSIVPSSIRTFYPAWFFLAFIHGISVSRQTAVKECPNNT